MFFMDIKKSIQSGVKKIIQTYVEPVKIFNFYRLF